MIISGAGPQVSNTEDTPPRRGREAIVIAVSYAWALRDVQYAYKPRAHEPLHRFSRGRRARPLTLQFTLWRSAAYAKRRVFAQPHVLIAYRIQDEDIREIAIAYNVGKVQR